MLRALSKVAGVNATALVVPEVQQKCQLPEAQDGKSH